MKSLAGALSLLPSLCAASQVSLSQMPTPPEIGIRVTIEGPVFVDAKGMTLYKAVKGSIESCDNRRHAVLLQDTAEGTLGFTVPAPSMATRRSCVQKHPPLLASANAKPAGKWSIRLREDGSRQWAYDGEPLYKSIKDTAPGEINGSYPPYPWTLALAPLIGAPAGISVRKTALGPVLVSSAGKALYYSDRAEVAPNSRLWQPFTAPVLAAVDGLSDWSVVTRTNGLRQWAYKARPLYTYAYDSDTAGNAIFTDAFGGIYGRRIEGWHVTLLKKAPTHPPEVTIQTLVEGDDFDHNPTTRKVYANAKGMTLYTIHCVERTADHLECDDVGDSPRYWVSFCGGEERCARTWLPLTASGGVKSIDDVWSVVTINPRHPWRAAEKGAPELSVWAFRGRPVFTYAHDVRPGDCNGAAPKYGGGRGIYARTVYAYETN